MNQSTDLQMRMTPIKTGTYYEQILVATQNYRGNWYPAMLLHIDTFWEGKDAPNTLYNALNKGDFLEVKVRFTIVMPNG